MLVKIGKCHHDQSLPLNRFHFSMFGVCLVLILLTSPIMWNSLVSCSNDFCFSFFPPCDCDRRENIQRMCSFWVSKNPRDLSAKKKKSGRSYQVYEIGKAQKLFPVENDPNFSFSFIKWLLLMYSQGTMTLECCNERLALLQISSKIHHDCHIPLCKQHTDPSK